MQLYEYVISWFFDWDGVEVGGKFLMFTLSNILLYPLQLIASGHLRSLCSKARHFARFGQFHYSFNVIDFVPDLPFLLESFHG